MAKHRAAAAMTTATSGSTGSSPQVGQKATRSPAGNGWTDAQSLTSMLGSVPYIASAHPSPLSARAGFFGSRPFSRANELLVRQGGEPINWALPPARVSLN